MGSPNVYDASNIRALLSSASARTRQNYEATASRIASGISRERRTSMAAAIKRNVARGPREKPLTTDAAAVSGDTTN